MIAPVLSEFSLCHSCIDIALTCFVILFLMFIFLLFLFAFYWFDTMLGVLVLAALSLHQNCLKICLFLVLGHEIRSGSFMASLCDSVSLFAICQAIISMLTFSKILSRSSFILFWFLANVSCTSAGSKLWRISGSVWTARSCGRLIWDLKDLMPFQLILATGMPFSEFPSLVCVASLEILGYFLWFLF